MTGWFNHSFDWSINILICLHCLNLDRFTQKSSQFIADEGCNSKNPVNDDSDMTCQESIAPVLQAVEISWKISSWVRSFMSWWRVSFNISGIRPFRSRSMVSTSWQALSSTVYAVRAMISRDAALLSSALNQTILRRLSPVSISLCATSAFRVCVSNQIPRFHIYF